MTLRIWLLQIEEIIEISSLVNALSRRVYEPETVSRKLIEILKFIFRNFKLIYYRVWRMHLSVCEISVRGIGFHILTSRLDKRCRDHQLIYAEDIAATRQLLAKYNKYKRYVSGRASVLRTPISFILWGAQIIKYKEHWWRAHIKDSFLTKCFSLYCRPLMLCSLI